MLDSLSSSVALMIQQSASEQALRKSEEKYRNIFENAMEGIFQSTPGGRCLSVNPSLAQMLGFDSPEEMISSVHDINARLCANPEERARLHKLLDNQGFVRGFIAECVHRTKVNVFIALNERSVRDKDGRILFYEGTTQDITEQVKSHMQISRINKCMISLRPDPRENIEMILNTTVETLGGACVLYNRFGSDRSLLCTRGIWHKPEGDEPEGMPDGYISYDVIVKGEPVIIEDLAVTKFEESDPNVRKYGLKSYLGYPVKVRGKTVGSLCLFDVTKRLFSKGEIKIFGIFAQALAMEEARIQNQRAMGMLARFPDENPYPVLRVAEDGTITYANTAAEKLPEDFQCRKGERVPEEWRESAAEALRTGVVRTIEFKTGEKYFLVTLSPIQTAGYVNIYGLDITKRKILESHVLHLQKMEAIGTLAGGIAHDINNMLAGIIGYINLMRKELSIDSQLTEDIQSIEKLSWRIADLVQGLLAFARKGKYVPEPLNIVPIVEEVLKLMGQTAGKLAAIEMECVPDVFNIIGDQSQINQLLMNLCINACEAMPNGGTLTVRIANEELDEEFFRIHSALKKGPFVSIRVSDTGVGMNEETRQRIFDPFFTTKDQKTGTGLGLSMVIGIAEVHGGCVEVESEPGRGSTFTIFFPATEKSIEEALPGPVETLRGNETILIVDDEKDFRVSTGRSLRELGYTVLEAASGDEALETLEKKSEEIDLVLLDMIMKGMGGPTTFRRMREIVPDLAVIICTGYSIDSNCHRLLKKGAKGFIQKPFEHNYLALRIREVLSSC